MNRYIITREQIKGQEYLISALYDENRKLIEVYPETAKSVSSETVSDSSLLGNIYIGRVDRVVTNLNAAFIKIAPGQNCYFSLEDLKNPIFTKKLSTKKLLAEGDELLVQVSKEALKTKDPVVTSNLTFTGKYAVLTTGKQHLSVSHKLSAPVRERFLTLLKQQLPQDNARSYGLIVRTNAALVSEEELLCEIRQLQETYQKILETSEHKTCFSCVYTEPAVWEKTLNGLRQNFLEEIVTDQREIFERICLLYGISKELLITGGSIKTPVTKFSLSDTLSLHFYEDTLVSLSSIYSLKAGLEEATRERVWLKSGAYLIIQPTEALTVIDVNTGKNVAKKDVQDNFLRVNKEAALEIARQLRLRNISGIIVVDFINLTSKEAEAALLNELKQSLRADPVPTQLIDMTRLGLVEITRKKVRKSLAEMIL